MTEPILRLGDLAVAYGSGRQRQQVLSHIDLSIAPGETLGLVGESGSGKTTLGRAVLGLVPSCDGTITFDGSDITSASPRRRRQLARDIQAIFQDPYSSLNPAMRIRDILIEPLIAQGVRAGEARTRVGGLLERVGMPDDTLDRFAREFSGGQRQRVAIARALALSPRLIVCDEPVSALDLSTQLRVLDLLIEIQRDTGVAFLFISHDLSVVSYLAHRIAVMLRGQIVELGDAHTVVANPQHAYTRRLWAANLSTDPDEQRERRRLRRSMSEAGDIASLVDQ